MKLETIIPAFIDGNKLFSLIMKSCKDVIDCNLSHVWNQTKQEDAMLLTITIDHIEPQALFTLGVEIQKFILNEENGGITEIECDTTMDADLKEIQEREEAREFEESLEDCPMCKKHLFDGKYCISCKYVAMDNDYYEQGSQSTEIDEFTEELLD